MAGAAPAGAEPAAAEAAGVGGPSSPGEGLGPVRGAPVRWDGLCGVPVEAFEVRGDVMGLPGPSPAAAGPLLSNRTATIRNPVLPN